MLEHYLCHLHPSSTYLSGVIFLFALILSYIFLFSRLTVKDFCSSCMIWLSVQIRCWYSVIMIMLLAVLVFWTLECVPNGHKRCSCCYWGYCYQTFSVLKKFHFTTKHN